MATSWGTILQAAEQLNEGNPEPALALCSPDALLKLGRTPGHPAGCVYYGHEGFRKEWERLAESPMAPLKVKPVDLLSDDQHLVLFLDVALHEKGTIRTHSLILIALAGDDGRWRELWLHGRD